MSRLSDPQFLKAYWPLNNHIEDVVGVYDMTETGTLLHTAGPHGRSARGPFETGKYVSRQVANFRIRDTQGAISAWIKTVDAGGGKELWSTIDSNFDARDYLSFGVTGSEVPRILHRIGEGTLTEIRSTGGAAPVGVWTHYIGQSTGSAYEMYINGEPVSTSVQTGSDDGAWLDVLPNRDMIAIGILADATPSSPFGGEIAEVRYHNFALTALEAKELFRMKPPRG